MRIRVGKTGIVMPRTWPATFGGEADEEAQERPVGAPLRQEEMVSSVLAGETGRPEAACSPASAKRAVAA